MYKVNLIIDEIEADDTTSGDDNWLNSRDEVYFAGVGAGTISESFKTRVPREGADLPGDDADYYGFHEGNKRTMIPLKELQIQDGEAMGVVFNVSEQDGLSPGKLYDALASGLETIGAATSTFKDGEIDFGKAGEFLKKLKETGNNLATGIDKGDDSIGGFGLSIIETNGKLTFEWTEGKDTKFLVKKDNVASFMANGSESGYRFKVRAEIVDTAVSEQSFSLTSSNDKNLFLTGDSASSGTGNRFDNSIVGNDASNTLSGGDGNDLLNGQAGDDLLFGEGDSDRLYGEHGNDLLYGGRGTDILLGGEDNDFLCGYYGGGDEFDGLVGGSGADTFGLGYNGSYTEIGYLGTGHAIITDFNQQEGDRIRLGGSISSYTLTESNGSTSINYNGDRIAILSGVTGLDLHASYFSVVGGHGS